MKQIRIALAVGTLVLLTGCPAPDGAVDASNQIETVIKRVDNETAAKFEVLYEGVPNPAAIAEKEVMVLVNTIKGDSRLSRVVQNYEERFGTNYQLWAYSINDLDGDKESDFVYSQSRKKFVAYDDDIDGDGTQNILDADPYDKTVTSRDSDSDTIPDHLDWDRDGDGKSDVADISDAMAIAQNDILAGTGVIPVNQDARHDLRTLKNFIEVAQIIFGKVVDENDGKFPMVKYLGAQHGEKDSQTLAWYREGHQLLTIEDLGRKQGRNDLMVSTTPLPFYSTVIHELGHALHAYLKKRDAKDLAAEKYMSHFFDAAGNFKGKTKAQWFTAIKADYAATDAKFDSIVREIGSRRPKPPLGKAKLEIAKRLPSFDPVRGELRPMRLKVPMDNNIISLYSLTSPEEYFAESVVAYTFWQIIDKRFANKPPKEIQKLYNEMHNYVEGTTGMQATNLHGSGYHYLAEVLDLDHQLVWDENYEQPTTWRKGLRGGWVRAQK